MSSLVVFDLCLTLNIALFLQQVYNKALTFILVKKTAESVVSHALLCRDDTHTEDLHVRLRCGRRGFLPFDIDNDWLMIYLEPPRGLQARLLHEMTLKKDYFPHYCFSRPSVSPDCADNGTVYTRCVRQSRVRRTH